MGRENANERDQVVIIASLGPLECPVKTVEINFTNSGFFLPTHEFWHSPRTYVHEAERPAGRGLPGELLEQSRVKDASDLNKERTLRFGRNPGG